MQLLKDSPQILSPSMTTIFGSALHAQVKSMILSRLAELH